jgi:hypothetical protein
MMTAQLAMSREASYSCGARSSQRFSRKKAQEMNKPESRNPLVDQLLRSDVDSVTTPAEINRLCDLIRETSFQIHKYSRSGHLEKIYENSLTHRLTKMGIEVVQQYLKCVLSRPALSV